MALVEQRIDNEAATPTRASLASAMRAKAVHVGWDLAVAGAAIVLASVLRPAGDDGATTGAVLLVSWALWLGRARLYSARFITRRSDEMRRIIDASLLSLASVAAIAFAFDLAVDRVWLGLASGLGCVALVSEREIYRRHYGRLRRSGRRSRRVLMIGDNDETRQMAAMFADEPELGYEVVEQIDPAACATPAELTTQALGAARRNDATGAVVAASAVETGASNRLIRDLIEAGIHVELSSTLADINPSRLTVRPLGRFPVVYVEPVLRDGWRAIAKRTFDLVTASLLVAALSPVLLGLYLAIKRDSEGPAIFKQSRVGQNGVPFDVMKFRTMVVNAEEILEQIQDQNEGAGPLFKMKDDPRVTKVGGFLRKTSLDELPQLFNVIKGEMSLVGPRPALAKEMAEWDADLYGRLRVKPGITGMWQVSGRSETTFEEYTRLDLYYVDNWSLVVDVSILFRTIPAVLKSDGAY